MSKFFKYDVILESEDLCDREQEQKRILHIMKSWKSGRKLVIYSPRRMGKTSLVHVCSKRFLSLYPKAFVLYVDLNELGSFQEVSSRFRAHYELALQDHFPLARVKSFLNALLSRLKLNLPGGVDLSLEEISVSEPQSYLLSLFQQLKKLSAEAPLILVLDEFQGISDLREVQALLRRELKLLSHAAVILMGSNQRLLYKMFNNKQAPFFSFGEDMMLKPIPVSNYLPYMQERFVSQDILIHQETASYLMQEMNEIPNYINELGAWIVDTMKKVELTKGHMDEAIESIVRSKSGRYESILYGYTDNQKKFIRAIARLGRVKAHTGQSMMKETRLTAVELSRVEKQLQDAPLISKDLQNNFYILDPFLRKFLQMMS